MERLIRPSLLTGPLPLTLALSSCSGEERAKVVAVSGRQLLLAYALNTTRREKQAISLASQYLERLGAQP